MISQIRAAPAVPPSFFRSRDSERTGFPSLCPQHAGWSPLFPCHPFLQLWLQPGQRSARRLHNQLLKYQGVVTVSSQRLFPLPYALLLIMPSSRTKPGVFILASGAEQSVLRGRGGGACNLPVTHPRTPGSDHAVALSEPVPRCASPRRAGHPGPISAPTEAREGGHRPWREAAGRGRGPEAGASGTSGRPAARTARATGASAGGCGAVAHAQSPPGHGLRQTLVPPLRPTEETHSRLA